MVEDRASGEVRFPQSESSWSG